MEKDIIAKGLNAILTGDKFENKDLDNYIYASLTQPPIKIIDKNNSEDELDFTVECPNCKRHVNYGNEIFMIGGHLYCSDDNCANEVIEKYKKLKGAD